MIRYCFFDLDGTLVNSLADIADAMNWALRQLDLPEYTLQEYSQKVGRGMDNLCRACLPEGREGDFSSLRQLYDARYTAHSCEKTALYPGLETALQELRLAGITMAVLTNKPQSQADQVAQLLQPYGLARVMGKQAGFPIKPDPTSLHWLMEQLGATPAESIYIGDSDVDIQLGKNAGLPTVGVTWGFRGEAELIAAGADYLCHDPADLGKLLLQKASLV